MADTAIVLLSGGIDSATTLAIANKLKFDLYALSFFYGQRHRFELKAAKKISKTMNVKEHLILNIDLRSIGGSALTDKIGVPKKRSYEKICNSIPVTYVPARNTIFLSLALAYAEVQRSQNIFIGVNALDYSGYPDCRPEYIQAFEFMANLATKFGIEGHRIKIHTPLIHLTKSEIIIKGIELGVNLNLTHSCYDPNPKGYACGHCDSCLIRKKGFKEADIPDPTHYISD